MRKKFHSASVPLPGACEGKRGETGHIGYLLRQAYSIHRLRMEKALGEAGVTPPQFLVLTMLAAYSGISSADVARLSFLTPQTVTVIVANLEKHGAIERRPHPHHGRIQQIGVTEEGTKLLRRCRKLVESVEAKLIDGLTAAQEKTVRIWLSGVASRGEDK